MVAAHKLRHKRAKANRIAAGAAVPGPDISNI